MRRWIAGALTAMMCGCSSEEDPGPSGNINYGGEWSGTIGDATLLQRRTIAWDASHDENTLTGTFRYLLDGGATATGTLVGTVSGESIFFTLTMPVGAFPAPVPESCNFSGGGNTTMATESTVTALLELTFHSSCMGTLTGSGTATHQLLLTR